MGIGNPNSSLYACIVKNRSSELCPQFLLEALSFIVKTHSCQFPDSSSDLASVLSVYALLQPGENHITEPVGKAGAEGSPAQLKTVCNVICFFAF